MRQRLEDKLMEVHEGMLKMSTLVEENVELSIRAFIKQDMEIVKEVIKNDDEIDRWEEKIEAMCIAFIATQNPLGSDLRRIFTILKLITDLERIGDNAVNIAEAVIKIGEEQFIKQLIDIPQMAKISRKMIYNSINSYIGQNTQLALDTINMDDEVDALYEKNYNDLLDKMETHSQYKNQIIGLLLIGRYLERIADHSTNICERVVYMTTGKRIGDSPTPTL